jgi:hypothetical protein
MSENLDWYPADWVDETCPPSKASPGDFIVAVDGAFELGYVRDTAAPGKIAAEYAELYNKPLAIGDVVNFLTCDRLGDVEVTFHRDGTMVVQGSLPSPYNVVIVNHDSDMLYDSVDELVAQLKSPDQWCNPAEYIFDKDEDTAQATLSFALWSDLLPHLFEIADGKPVFRPVPVQKQ